MKKVGTYFFLISLLTSVSSCSANSHIHHYNLVKASESTCNKHGYSIDHYECSCGGFFDIETKQEIDKSTIELPLGDHKIGTYRIEHHYHVKYCQYCGMNMGSENHVYDQHNANSDLLFKSATCTEHAQYYVSCICGLSSKDTDEVMTFIDVDGPLGEHEYIYHEAQEPLGDEDGYEEYYSCQHCEKLFDINKNEIQAPTPIPTSAKIIIQNKYKGQEVDLLYGKARQYLETDNPAEFLYNYSSSPDEYTPGITFTWKFNGGAKISNFDLATDSEFENIVYTQPTSVLTTLTLYNLVPGTYYYRIRNSEYTSNYDYFTIKDGVRAINMNKSVYNMRDLGGWITEDNKVVKYGKLFRSAQWKNMDVVGEARIFNLGIKTELDIRRSSGTNDYSSSEHPLEGVNYINSGMGQYTGVIPGAMNYYAQAVENLANTFAILADENNYPLVFHCTAGADRTGTLAFIILGMLGVNYEQLVQDFELTSLFYNKRWRSQINVNDGVYSFDESGIMQNDAYNFVAFDKMYNSMLTLFPPEDGKLSTSIKKYLTNALGVTSETINKIISIML